MTPTQAAATQGSNALQFTNAVTIDAFGYQINVFASLILVLFAAFVYALWRARNDTRVDWIDTITTMDQATGKVQASVTKILQIVGGIVGTFVVVKTTLEGVITWDIFAIYLAYVASIEGFSRFILAKYGVTVPPTATGALPIDAAASPVAPVVPQSAPASVPNLHVRPPRDD